MKNKKVSLLKVLLIPSLLPIIFITSLIYTNETSNFSFVNKAENILSESHEINFETEMNLINFSTDSSGTEKREPLIYNDSNKVSEFINGNSFIFDLNKFKPQGMKTDLFLENTYISLDGPIINGNFKNEINIKKISKYAENNSNPESSLKVNKNIHSSGEYESTDNIIFTLDGENITKTKTYILINKILDIKTNILKITPYIVLKKPISVQTSQIQKLTINFSSPFFEYNPRNNIVGNQYFNSENTLSLSETIPSENSTPAIRDYYTMNSNDIEGSSSITTSKILPNFFNIDVNDFYWNDINSNLKPININVQGLKFDKLSSKYNSIASNKIISNKIPINFSFQITPQDMIENEEIIFTFDILNNTQWSNLPKDNSIATQAKKKTNRAEVSLTIEKLREPTSHDGTIGEVIPKKYRIKQFKFDAIAINDIDNVSYEVHSSNLKILTSPMDYSFLGMKQTIKKIANEFIAGTEKDGKYKISSDYSSDIFNDDFIIENNDKKITNYRSAVDVMNKKLENILGQDDFLKAGIVNSSIENKNLFGEPFSSSNYTSGNLDAETNENTFLTTGIMKFNVSPLKKFRYFDSLEFSKEFIVDNPSDSNIIEVSINNDFLSREALRFDTFKEFLYFLNNQPKDEYYEFINNILDWKCLSAKIPTSSSSLFNLPNIKFTQDYDGVMEQKNIINISLEFQSVKYKVLQNQELLSNFELKSNQMNFESIPTQTINISINQNELFKEAKLFDNYESFAQKWNNFDKLKKFIKETEHLDKIKDISLVNPNPSKNLIIIKIELINNLFDNNLKTKEFSTPNVNWKDQNNVAQMIDISINGKIWDEYFKNFDNKDDFIKNNENKKPIDFISFFDFNDSSMINNIESISFLPGDNPNKIKINLVAKEWFYFETKVEQNQVPSIVFDRGNIIWKGKEPIANKVSIGINWKFIYEEIKEYTSMKKFINDKNINFWTKKVITLNPTSFSSVENFTVLTNENFSLIIKINLNNGFYFDENDMGNLNYFLEITKDDFQNMHSEMTNPDSSYFINIIPNFNLMFYEAKNYINAKDFLKTYNNTNKLYDLLTFIKGDIRSIKEITLKVNPNNANSLIMSVVLNDNYFFISENTNVSFLEFPPINNILWKGEVQNLTYIDLMINFNKFLIEAQKVDNFEEFSKNFSNNELLNQFIVFTNGSIENIEKLSIRQGSSKSEIIFTIIVKPNFYFKNESISQSYKEFLIGNVSWKGETILLKPISITIDGNKIMENAKIFNNFDAFSQNNNSFENLKKFIIFDIGDLSQIYNISLFKSNVSNNQIIIRVSLKPKSYFESEGFTSTSMDFLLGNIFYLGQEKELEEAKITFNEKRFYELIKEYKDEKDINLFIQENTKKFFNPLANHLAVLIINPNDINIISSFSLYTNSENDLIIKVILKNGYYLDENNKTNTELNWKIKKNDFINLHNKIENQKNKNSDFNLILTISLSVTIPVIIVGIIATIIIIKKRNIRKQGD